MKEEAKMVTLLQQILDRLDDIYGLIETKTAEPMTDREIVEWNKKHKS